VTVHAIEDELVAAPADAGARKLLRQRPATPACKLCGTQTTPTAVARRATGAQSGASSTSDSSCARCGLVPSKGMIDDRPSRGGAGAA
jgi:hypothetical protein